MPTTVYLSLRGDGASRALEGFRRALGAEAETLVVVPNRDDTGYYGSAEVDDVAAAREAFAAARKLYPTLKAFIGVGGREPEEPPARPQGGAPAPRNRPPDQKPRPPEQRSSPQAAAREKQRGKDVAQGHDGEASKQRMPLRRRNRNQRRQAGGTEDAP